jgi:hypothetical protein
MKGELRRASSPDHENGVSGALIYMHIPKCGGTTLTSVLTRAVPHGSQFLVDGSDIAGSRARLGSLPETERRRIRLVCGHLSFGWHELLLPVQAQYFTLLRDPVSRVVSHYNHVCAHEDHYLHADVVSKKMTIADYVESGITCEVNNGQVRQIMGIEDIIQIPYGVSVLPYGRDHNTALEQALKNIQDHFLLVGLLERFDETVHVLKQITGIPLGAHRSRNVGKSDSAVKRPTRTEIELIRRYNREDCELYAYCKERFAVLALRAGTAPSRRSTWSLLTRRN